MMSSRDEVEGLMGSFLAGGGFRMLRTNSNRRTVSVFCGRGSVTLLVLSIVVPGVSN